VLAPLDGVVTSRNTDIGALINAGQGTALFSVADVRKLRVYVQVPQLYASSTTPGLDADLTFAERLGKTYPARVVSTADALDPNSRTLQVELLVDNARGELFPGAYAQVHFKLPSGPDSCACPQTPCSSAPRTCGVRNTVAAARANAQASAADLAVVDLRMHAEVALDYFTLRSAVAQQVLLDQTVSEYGQALELAQNLYNGGAAPLADVAQAQLETAHRLTDKVASR
jgi:hypothetical protein